MKTPYIDIYLNKIIDNARIMRKKCEKKDIKLTGVVKGAAGDKKVAEAFIEAGIESLGDSRLKNIIGFRKAGIDQEMVLLRLPRIEEVEKIVKNVDISLVSEIATIKALSRAAVKYNRKHGIIIMVDVGDLREGVLPENLETFFDRTVTFSGINICGLGTNVGCYGGVLPTHRNTKILLEKKEKIEKKFSIKLDIISGGNTATTILLNTDSLPEEINNLRVGEGILLGTDVTNQRVIKYLNQNNFILTASIIEIKDKPSVPEGEIGCDAFGNKPEFKEKGIRCRAILALGRQDTRIDGLTPELKKAEILGASSDHLLVDITEVKRSLKVGDEMKFTLNYGAMLAAMTSPYVEKKYHK